MKKYYHDYRLPRQALGTLTRASDLFRQDGLTTASDYVDRARSILDEYLSQDNMVEDDDVYPGWIRATDLEQEQNCFKDLDHSDAFEIFYCMNYYVIVMQQSGVPATELSSCIRIIDKLFENL